MAKELDLNKDTLTEAEVNLLMRRINSKKINPQDIPHFQDGEGYKLTDSQIAKGKAWLIDQWKSPTGRERVNNPFGYREEQILEKLREIRLKDVYSERGNFYIPLYEVLGDDTSMEYYVLGGKISIVG